MYGVFIEKKKRILENVLRLLESPKMERWSGGEVERGGEGLHDGDARAPSLRLRCLRPL